jgi:transglutaminase-like putative cysteine protease
MFLETVPPSSLLQIPDGVEGTKATLKLMSDLVKAGKKSLTVRSKALALTDGLPQKDRAGEVRALFNYVKEEIRYIRDPSRVELLQFPEQTMSQASGDCDDKSVLLAALLEAIGHPTRFVAMGFTPGTISHVLVDTRWGSGWLPLDTTVDKPMGWRPPNIAAILPPWYN